MTKLKLTLIAMTATAFATFGQGAIRAFRLFRILGVGGLFILFYVISASGAIHYVDLGSTNPISPYSDWVTASTDIQSAIDSSTNGDLILVTNGLYQTGGRPLNGYASTNRVTVDKPVTVQSVNGALATIIQGYQVPGTTNGDSAVRCVYMTNRATLIGFTLTGGATLTNGLDWPVIRPMELPPFPCEPPSWNRPSSKTLGSQPPKAVGRISLHPRNRNRKSARSPDS